MGDASEHVVHLTRNAGNVGTAWDLVGSKEDRGSEMSDGFTVVCLTEVLKSLHRLQGT